MFSLNWFWSMLYKIGLLQKKASIILVGMPKKEQGKRGKEQQAKSE
jgi:hypothetical protein